MKFSFFKTRKAQSATEYLMTYGWAILAIAIVGALLYTQVFSTKKCAEGANGFPMAGGVSIDGNQFTVTAAGNIQVKLRNNMDSMVNNILINSIAATEVSTTCTGGGAADGDTEANCESVYSAALAVTAGTAGACYSAETITITYDVDQGVAAMTSSGTISGRYA